MDKWLKSLTSCGSNKIPPSADQIKAPHEQSIRGKEKYCENKVEQNGEAGIGSNLGISIIPPSSYTNGFGLHRGTQANLAQGEGRLSKNSSNGCLSRRATESVGTPHEALVHMAKVWEDRFHPTDNVQGYVDLGLAENKLCEDILSEKFKRLPDDSEDIGVRYYTDKRGLPCFRESLQVFIEREFQSIHSIDASNIVLGAGLTPVFDTLAFVLTEHGDYIMTTSPYYYMFKKDIAERAGVRLLTVQPSAQVKTEAAETTE
ncbi:1-aminocyclopropane-1-carboxylate synthase-like protein 1 [Aplysia californica]|uniref:1-aminocyclopropane-1-carboxylate synthase-like protein 1 n=1 Tax=Aplysia californica TaxID=6500 RepID=A0ABM1VYN0_APLCA|nr:1-aminocyclopropane-1-carboxylate synthase-like protein 1 [Aplysia californica]